MNDRSQTSDVYVGLQQSDSTLPSAQLPRCDQRKRLTLCCGSTQREVVRSGVLGVTVLVYSGTREGWEFESKCIFEYSTPQKTVNRLTEMYISYTKNTCSNKYRNQVEFVKRIELVITV